MAEVYDFFIKSSALAPQYPRYIFLCMIICVMLLTELLKLPIKHFTNKIQQENWRKRINMVIMFFPTGIAFAICWVLTLFDYPLTFESALAIGTASMVGYEFLKRIFARKQNGEVINDEVIKEEFENAVEDVQDAVDTVQSATDNFYKLAEEVKNEKVK